MSSLHLRTVEATEPTLCISNATSLNVLSSTGAELNIEEITAEAGITSFEFNAPSNPRIGASPILDNGLNLLYAPQSYGKSYTSIEIAVESGLPAVFIDLESNGNIFVNHCRRNGVAYVYAGSAKNILEDVRKLVRALKSKFNKVLIIIDSYSDLFPDDEGKMAQHSQKQLGDMHRFFMREVELPILILDHATENKDHEDGFKIEGNKSGKFKKTVSVLRLKQIGNDIGNGTYVTVERSRNQDKLPKGHTQYYRRNAYLKDKLQILIEKRKLHDEFTATDLKSCIRGDDRKLWQEQRDEIAERVKSEGKKEYWKLK